MDTMKPGLNFPDERELWQPKHLIFERNDRLFVRHAGSVASIRIAVRGRILDTSGQIRPFEQTLSVSSDRSFGFDAIDVGEGWLLSVAVFASSGSPAHGRIWASVGILRGLDVWASQVQILACGYVTISHGPHWPDGDSESSLQGRGAIRAITGSDPAAGAEVSETVPSGTRWHLTSFGVTLAADGTAANRRPRLKVTDGSSTLFRIPSQADITASETIRIDWIDAGAETSDPSHQVALLPVALHLEAGWTIETDTENLQAGDDYGAPVIGVEEWIA